MTGILDGVRVLDLSTRDRRADHRDAAGGPRRRRRPRRGAGDRGPDRPGEVVWHRGTRRVELDVTAADGGTWCSTWRRAPTSCWSRSACRRGRAGPRARRPARRQPPSRAHVDHRLRPRYAAPTGRTSNGWSPPAPGCRPTSAAGTAPGWTTSWASTSPSRASTCPPAPTSSAAGKARSSSPCRGPASAPRCWRRRPPAPGCTSSSAPASASTSRRRSPRPSST